MLYPFHWIEQKSCTQFIGQNTLKAIYHEPLDVETWEWVRIEAGCWGYLPWRKGEGSGRQAGLNQHIYSNHLGHRAMLDCTGSY